MHTDDQNFDGLVEHFEKKIYGSMKGQLRLQLIRDSLLEKIPDLKEGKLRILDVAGGLGQIAIWLAKMGHQVTIGDISIEMLQRSQQLAIEAGVKHGINWIHSPLQQLQGKISGNFDLIIAHAILEWMDKPKEGFQTIAALASSKTQVSLTFYNRQAIILHNVLRGNFRKVLSDNFRGEVGGLTPLNPLQPDTVRAWVKHAGFFIKQQVGLRSFYDYLTTPIKEKINKNDIIQMERRLSQQQPFIDMARYVHLLLEKE